MVRFSSFWTYLLLVISLTSIVPFPNAVGQGKICTDVGCFNVPAPGIGGPKPLHNLDDGFNEKLRLYLETDPSLSPSFLSLDKDASTADAFKGRTLQDNEERGVWEFSLLQTLPQTYFLNLSKPLNGTLYWKSVMSEPSAKMGQTRDQSHLRIEVRVGEEFAGGTEFIFYPSMVSSTVSSWSPFYFYFRPELAQFESGSSVTLRVLRLEGEGEFFIGTGGDHQSFLEAFYFNQDPLASALYVQDRQILTSVSHSSSTSSSRGPTSSSDSSHGMNWWGLGGLGLPLLGALAVRRKGPPKGWAALLGFFVIGVGFAGCLEDPSVGPEFLLNASHNPSNVEYVNDTVSNLGSINGTVVQEATGLPVSQAHVSIPGTNRFATSDSEGRFRFENMIPKIYVLRVDAQVNNQPVSVEEPVNVIPAKIAQIQIVLGKNELGIHQHDEWGTDEKRLFQDPIVIELNHTTCTTNLKDSCTVPVPIDYSNRVLPGTSIVEVTFEWKNPFFQEVGLEIRTIVSKANSKEEDLPDAFLPRESGKPIRIPIFPDEADPGHQVFTNWNFGLLILSSPPRERIDPLAESGTNLLTTTVQVTIWLHKGVVPFEPAHRDFWQGAYELELLNDVQLKDNCSLLQVCERPRLEVSWVLPAGLFVPPGTKELRGNIHWEATSDLPIPDQWSIAYKPANVPFGEARKTFRPATMVSVQGKTTEFLIEPTPEETDQFYHLHSNWLFSPDDLDQPAKLANFGRERTFYLTLKAIRDPNYDNQSS